jgi:hypothetical protein
MRSVVLGVAAAGCAIVFTGCISHESTVEREAVRVKVEFENDAAARTFYEALSKSKLRDEKTESSTKFEIPILFEHTRHVVVGRNSAFNRAVELCDTNQDGRITEAEARIFAEQQK